MDEMDDYCRSLSEQREDALRAVIAGLRRSWEDRDGPLKLASEVLEVVAEEFAREAARLLVAVRETETKAPQGQLGRIDLKGAALSPRDGQAARLNGAKKGAFRR